MKNLYPFLPKYESSQCGEFYVEQVFVPKGTPLMYYDARAGIISRRPSPANTYWALRRRKDGSEPHHWMDTTQLEIEGLRFATLAARGKVLTSGLGLGVFPTLLLKLNKNVSSITVVEVESDVIKLISPFVDEAVGEGRVNYVCGNIFSYAESSRDRFDYIYLDIWDSIIGPIIQIQDARAATLQLLSSGGAVRVWLQELIERIEKRLPKKPVPPSGITIRPCLVCGKFPRNDYAGVCMDCADSLCISEMFLTEE